MMRRHVLTAVVSAISLIGCGGKSTTAPSTAPPAATLQSVAFSATLSSLTRAGNTAQVTATGTFSDGTTQNVTSTCTDWASDNTFVLTITSGGLMTALHSGSSTVTAICRGVFGRGLVTLTLIPETPFVQSGVGDNVFTLPSYVTRVRVDATYGGSCQNFIVRISTQTSSLINVIIGTCSVADTRSPFSGTYAINNGGTVTITNSTGIAWTFTELR